MRLICSSCGAQYEVDDSVIPETGRDVQCSNCGHAWFQAAALQLTTPVPAEAPPPIPEDDVGGTGPEAPTAAASEPEPVAKEAPEPADGGDEEEMPVPAPSGGLDRRKLDDSVRSVLQDEAEREVRARKSESAALETQPDLGLTAAVAGVMADAAAGGEARDRVVRVRGDEDDLDDDALTSRASRRELLPDIEEINSTLRATSERGDEAAARDAPEALSVRQRSGFRRGFSLAVIIAALGFALYILSPVLAQSVPALEPTLAAYVAVVDAARVWLDEQMQALTIAIKGSANG